MSMGRLHLHRERHLVERIGWLRAAVLGANDRIVSTASLIVGVAAASARQHDILIAGVAGLVAGAMSMAAGEYVSVSSQSDTEHSDLARERKELGTNIDFEREELADIYVRRGVDQELARQVARQLMAKDALAAHARDELVLVVSASSLGFLGLLGAIGARAGGANVLKATVRVTFWGAMAMALTAGIGAVFGTVV
jgi:vacuolar iron transporter family protein